jgi:predicted nucleotidyltransferase
MFPKTHFNVDDARVVSQRIEAILGQDLRSVMLFGSAAHGVGHDLDMVFITSDKLDYTTALPTIRHALAALAWPIDAHIVRESEVTRRPFCLNTQGAYLLPILKEAVVLFGNNPYLAVEATHEDLAADALRKVQHYVFRLRQAAVGCNRTEKPEADRWLKFLRKCAYDVLAVHGVKPSFHEAPRTFAERWPEVFTTDETQSLDESDEATLEQVLPLMERLYAAAPRLLNLQAV